MDIDYSALTRELDTLRDQLKYIKICGTLGDPILYPRISELLRYLSDFPAQIELSTNGNPHGVPWWYDLAKNAGPKTEIQFSIDGIRTYSVYRKGGSFQKVFNNMRSYIHGGGTASWKFILFDHNIDELEEAIEMARKAHCKSFIKVISGVYNESLIKPKELIIPLYDNIRCQSLEDKSISIDADGEVMPCCGFKPIKSIINKDVKITNDFMTMLAWGKEKSKLNIHTSTIKKAMETIFFRWIYDNYRDIAKCDFLCRKTRRDEKDFYERIDL
jgi:MoaA/NifB/PqqE/SkfB family radical SAM enzyme